MKKELFETKIIDKEKEKRFRKIKQKDLTIHGIIATIFFTFVSSDISDSLFGSFRTKWIVMGMILTVFLIGSVYMIVTVYIKTPSIGKIIFFNDSLSFVIEKQKTDIQLLELIQVDFYIENDNYSIEIRYFEKAAVFAMDIIFEKEKEQLQEIINIWKEKGFKIKVHSKFNPALDSIKNKLIEHKTSENSRINLTKYKVKIRMGNPPFAISTIPYNSHPKEELFALIYKCFEFSGWEIKDYYENGIVGLTDPIIKTFGDYFTVVFNEDCFVLRSENVQGGLFSFGSKNSVSVFLENMTILSNEFDSQYLVKLHDELISKKACF